jgi:predicted nucleic acid-binding protein
MAARCLLYLDTSAMAKRFSVEAESRALEAYLREHSAGECVPISSELLRTELVRAVLPGGPTAQRAAEALLNDLEQIPVTRAILDRAGTLLPGERLRSLDAIHLASALGLGAELIALVSYDARMLRAAAQLGLATANPT